TPKFYIELAYKCMSASLNECPTAEEIEKVIRTWSHALFCTIDDLRNFYKYSDEEIDELKSIKKEFLKMDNIEFDPSTITATVHPNATYTSRLLKFANLPQPVNSNKATII